MSTENNVAKHEGKLPERVEQRRTLTPAVDVYENANALLILADMPGVGEDDVNIRFEKNQLTLEGTCRLGENDESGFVYSRSFVIPSSIDPEKIGAELKHGVLRVTMPKRDTLRPRQISVKAA